MPKVSVLIPIFNVEKYLRQCLDSVVKQTLRDIEIICINDGSTDGSLAIIEEYAARDPRIVVIDKANTGYGDSMNRGLDLATGEYVGIVESDDWAETDMFEELYKLATSTDADVVKSNFFSYYTGEKSARSGEKVYVVHPAEAGQTLRVRENIHSLYQQPAIWSAIYKRDFLNDHQIRFLPSPGASYQDAGFAFKVWAQAERTTFTDEAYLHYRRDNEDSSVKNPGKVFCVVDEYKEVEEYLTKHNLMDDLDDVFSAVRWSSYAWNIDRLTSDLASEFIDAISSTLADAPKPLRGLDANHVRDAVEVMENPEKAKARKRAVENAVISVIVPVYNDSKHLKHCMDSILGQSFASIEVIVVDDGSSDASVEMLEEYFESDVRVTLISKNNGGLSSARNAGLERAHGKWISFVDADDYLTPTALEDLYNAAMRDQVEIVHGRTQMVFEPGTRTAIERREDDKYYELPADGKHRLSPELMKKMDVAVWNKLFSRAIVENKGIRFPTGLKFEDAYFVNAFCWNAESITFIEQAEPVYVYRRRAGSIMANTFGSGANALDHVVVGFMLLDIVKKLPAARRKVWGPYYALVLRNYVWFALRYVGPDQREALWRMLSGWLGVNYPVLNRLDSLIAEEIRHTLPAAYSRAKGPASLVALQHRLQDRARGALHRFSPSYRAAHMVLRRLDGLQVALENLAKSQKS